VEHSPFPVSTAKKGKFKTIGEIGQIGVRALPILSFPLCCDSTIDPVIHTLPVSKAQ
jgi:hypothetical protein